MTKKMTRKMARHRKKAKTKARARRAAPVEAPSFKHCDDYIDDPAAPAALRKYLEFARAPAHGQLLPRPHPQLFADHDGKRVRVTMASRMGDVGITTDFTAEMGYENRVPVSQLGNFSEVS